MIHCTRKVTDHIFWVGGNDRRLGLFENLFPVPTGVSYNSYLIMDEKTTLMDTADQAVSNQFLENVTYILNGRELDYLVVNHMEPDHGAAIEELSKLYPSMKIVGNAKTFQLMKQFFNIDIEERGFLVGEGDELQTGMHTLRFYMAPMVHWPEVMTAYEIKEKILFSADAFGSFGALDGNLFHDELNEDRAWLAEARRYYVNIVGKYGAPVQTILKKLNDLDIRMICSLHGPVWRKNLDYLFSLYHKWSTYEPEDKSVVILYASMYGNTENAADALAGMLAESGIRNIVVYDISNIHISYQMAEVFRCSHIVLAAPTYNGGVFPAMESLLLDMKALNLKNRTVALIDNSSWAGVSAKQMKVHLEELKDMRILTTGIPIKSTLIRDSAALLQQLRDEIMASLAD